MPPVTKEQARQALLVGAARGLGLLERMPARFAARGWPRDDRMHVAIGAVCCVALNCGPQRWVIAPGTDDPECWKALVGRSTSHEIVEALELGDMLKPSHIMVAAGKALAELGKVE